MSDCDCDSDGDLVHLVAAAGYYNAAGLQSQLFDEHEESASQLWGSTASPYGRSSGLVSPSYGDEDLIVSSPSATPSGIYSPEVPGDCIGDCTPTPRTRTPPLPHASKGQASVAEALTSSIERLKAKLSMP